MSRRIFCKVLLVIVAVFSLLVVSGVLSAQGRSEDGLQRAKAAQERHTDTLMARPGVVGTAVGLNENGQHTVMVLLERPGVGGIPNKLDDVPVRPVVTGKLYALVDPTARFPRPVPTGVSTGHPNITAGTIGCRVTDGSKVYALSNNHVYACENNATIGDAVIQPGTYDGGISPADDIGTLSDFELIVFSTSASNEIDAAIAATDTTLLGTATPSDGYGVPKSTTAPPALRMEVQKYGRTTGLTSAKISGINAIVNVGYDSGTARFVDQILIRGGGFSAGGDSGSLVVTKSDNPDDDRKPIGLLFAGSSSTTVANPIGLVLSHFGVTVDDSPEDPEEPVTDIAITVLDAPTSAVQGDVEEVYVTVENVGNQDVTSDIPVSLTDDTDLVTIETQTISGGLAAGASATLTFTWDTSGASPAEHTLTANHGFADDDTTNDSMSTTVNVTEPGPPVADFSGSPTSGNAPLTVDFTDLSTGEIDSWLWDFGDGGTSTEPNPSYEYTAVEVYTVSLTVTGPHGSDTEIKVNYITVTEPGTEPAMHVADIAISIKKAGINVNAIATVTVVDADGPVAGATVSGSWSGLTGDVDSGITDENGNVSLSSNKVKNANGTFTFTVDNVVKSGWDYDNSVKPSASITVP